VKQQHPTSSRELQNDVTAQRIPQGQLATHDVQISHPVIDAHTCSHGATLAATRCHGAVFIGKLAVFGKAYLPNH